MKLWINNEQLCAVKLSVYLFQDYSCGLLYRISQFNLYVHFISTGCTFQVVALTVVASQGLAEKKKTNSGR